MKKGKELRWLVGLVVSAVFLPLAMFAGNLGAEGQEGGHDEAPETESFPVAPELAGISGWINSGPLAISELRGKVVLVDFWTYSCINCIRTLPYLNSWNEKYGDKGLVIVGVHSPEFGFEKDIENVKKAVAKYGIKYAVALDNDHSTWRAFKNNYWPRKYLIDANGRMRYDRIGEGGYEETEKKMQELLRERSSRVRLPDEMAVPVNAVAVNYSAIATSEVYLGYEYARVNLGNEEGFKPGKDFSYALPPYDSLRKNLAYVGGTWKAHPDGLELSSDEGRIVLKYTAKDVNIVASPGGQPSELQVIIDGDFISEGDSGSDVDGSMAVVSEQRLHNLVSGKDYSTRTLEINIRGKGFKMYTFTFG
ncbi:thioredoxin family protein [Candidatus Woesearchaeota archaeon]|nr:thioredoxin family protein [Candidatus Woesearchaeota archaeon]